MIRRQRAFDICVANLNLNGGVMDAEIVIETMGNLFDKGVPRMPLRHDKVNG